MYNSCSDDVSPNDSGVIYCVKMRSDIYVGNIESGIMCISNDDWRRERFITALISLCPFPMDLLDDEWVVRTIRNIYSDKEINMGFVGSPIEIRKRGLPVTLHRKSETPPRVLSKDIYRHFLNYLSVSILDDGVSNDNLLKVMNKITIFTQLLCKCDKKNRVLIHCHEGRSRSVAVACGLILRDLIPCHPRRIYRAENEMLTREITSLGGISIGSRFSWEEMLDGNSVKNVHQSLHKRITNAYNINAAELRRLNIPIELIHGMAPNFLQQLKLYINQYGGDMNGNSMEHRQIWNDCLKKFKGSEMLNKDSEMNTNKHDLLWDSDFIDDPLWWLNEYMSLCESINVSLENKHTTDSNAVQISSYLSSLITSQLLTFDNTYSNKSSSVSIGSSYKDMLKMILECNVHRCNPHILFLKICMQFNFPFFNLEPIVRYSIFKRLETTPSVVYKCKMCRTILFCDTEILHGSPYIDTRKDVVSMNVIDRDVFLSKQSPEGISAEKLLSLLSGIYPEEGISDNGIEVEMRVNEYIPQRPVECRSIFIQTMDYMRQYIQTKSPTVIRCFMCNQKLGCFSWVGIRCNCGEFISPGIQLHTSRLDEHIIDYEDAISLVRPMRFSYSLNLSEQKCNQ